MSVYTRNAYKTKRNSGSSDNTVLQITTNKTQKLDCLVGLHRVYVEKLMPTIQLDAVELVYKYLMNEQLFGNNKSTKNHNMMMVQRKYYIVY